MTAISVKDYPLEALDAGVDFERFRPILERAAGKPRGAKGGRPALDVMVKFKMLVLRSRHGLSFEVTEDAVQDRPGWMRFCGLGVADAVPDANALWDFREALIKAGELEALFTELERMINEADFISRSGQIVMAAAHDGARPRRA